MINKLSPREARFVEAISRGLAKAEAAAVAGYSPQSAGPIASRLLGREHVRRAIRKHAQREIDIGMAIGAKVLLELAEKAKSEEVRLRAACALIDRGGMQLIRQSEHRIIIDDKRTDAELLEHLRMLAQQLGVPFDTKIIDAEASSAPSANADSAED